MPSRWGSTSLPWMRPKCWQRDGTCLAEEIKAEARWSGVPIVENPPLARSLYRSVEVGQAIPVDLYAAVAAILAFLYRQRVEEEIRERRGGRVRLGPRRLSGCSYAGAGRSIG